jgi:hypothetical protein
VEKLFGKSGKPPVRCPQSKHKEVEKPHFVVFSHLAHSIENASDYFPNSFSRHFGE